MKHNILKQKLFNSYSNIRGWHTNRNILLIESDDWGSIRTPSAEINKILYSKGYKIDNCHYMKYDSLESEDDLELLLELLKSIKNGEGISPKITANCLIANPDFKKIKENNFQNYYYENVTESYKAYPKHTNVLKLWKEGIKENIFKMQSHGREHLNISRWMKDLQNGEKEVHLLFNLKSFGLSTHISKRQRRSYLAAFDGGKMELIYDRAKIIYDCLNIFESLYKYRSLSFIPPNFVWDDYIERALFNNNVKFIQTQRARPVSSDFGSRRKIKRHYLGQKNKYQCRYLVRNCEFEPSSNPNIDWVDKCLNEIKTAFLWKKPAIISIHRVNFIGFIDEANRDKNLRLFKKLLSEIIKKWPEVEFISSDELGLLISNGK